MRAYAVAIAYGDSSDHWTGSGVRIGPRQVLTAAHVLKGAPADLRVLLNGFKSLKAKVAWQHSSLDVALLAVDEDFPAAAPPILRSDVPTGRPWEASGFPRLTQRGRPACADLYQVTGTTCSCPPGQPMLALDLRTTARLPGEDGMPPTAEVPGVPVLVYGGLSGAGVWVDGQVAGIIGQLRPELQGSQVEAIPYGAFASADFHRAAGLSEVARLDPAIRLARVRKRIAHLLHDHPAVARLLRAAFGVEDTGLVDALLGQGTDVVDTCIEALAALDEHLDPRDLQALDAICRVLFPMAIDLRHCVVRTASGHYRTQVRTETLAELIMADEDGRELWVEVPRDPDAELVAAARVPTPSTTVGPFLDLDGHLLRQNLVGAVADYFKCRDHNPQAREQYARGKLRSRLRDARRPYLALEGSEARLQVVETIINQALPGLALVHLAGGGIDYEEEVFLVDRLGTLLRRLRPEARL